MSFKERILSGVATTKEKLKALFSKIPFYRTKVVYKEVPVEASISRLLRERTHSAVDAVWNALENRKFWAGAGIGAAAAGFTAYLLYKKSQRKRRR